MANLTIQDFHRLLDQEIQNMGFFAYQGLETEEIDLQINAQIELFVEAVLDKVRNKKPRIGAKEGFQESEVRLDDLRTIHVKDEATSLSAYNTNEGVKFTLPTTYRYHIKTKVNWSRQCVEDNELVTKTGTSQIRIGETENIENMRVHPFYKTTKDSPLAEIVGDIVYIYTNDFTITSAKIDYIKKPAVVVYGKDGGGSYNPGTSVHCDLPPTTFRTIIRMTAIHICSILEHNQQKVVNLKEEVN